MDIRSIRDKYKMIINCDDNTLNNSKEKNQQNQSETSEREQQSEREWIKIVKNNQKKRVLTESNHYNQKENSHVIREKENMNNSKKNHLNNSSIKKSSAANSKAHSSTYQSTILTLKQKLAQSIADSKQKSNKIQQLQHQLEQKSSQICSLNKKIHSLKLQCQSKDNLISQSKQFISNLQQKLQQSHLSTKAQQIDNQLLKTQISHYRKQIQSLSYKFQQKQQQFNKFNKELKKNTELKNKIGLLNDDVKRLQFLLSSENQQIYSQIFVALQGKHFLGKPNKQGKQLQYWYPELLIQGVERFLKKQKIGYGNRKFTQNIVKFIYGLLDRNQKKCQKKCRSIYNSRIKQIQRKKNHILNVMDITSSQINCNNINNNNMKTSANVTQYNTNTSKYNSRLCASQLRQTLNTSYSGQKSKGFSTICMNLKNINNSKKSPLGRSTASEIKNNYSAMLPLSANKKSFLIQGLEKSIKLNTQKRKQLIFDLVESFCDGIEKIFKKFVDSNKKNCTSGFNKINELVEWFKDSIQEVMSGDMGLGNYRDKGKGKEDERNCNSTGKWKTVGEM